ncbi:MAG: HlyC/CorC family transporter, partial [bacterium]|nr:HlyC/CorC family transporter [bacterium]
KKSKKALMLRQILNDPEEFFSTILIGNNLVNIAATSISTVFFTHLLTGHEEFILVTNTLVTTTIILLFAEIIPKSYAFRYSEKMSYVYAYPIKFFKLLFYPIVKATTFFSSIVVSGKQTDDKDGKDLTPEEVKHFLATEINLFRYNPDSLRMLHEIIDIAERDIKSIMTPRPEIIALEETAGMDELSRLITDKNLSKIPLYRDNLDNITGIIHTDNLLPAAMDGQLENVKLSALAIEPIFISEYSSLDFTLKEFKKTNLKLAVILDEYGAAIGLITLNDIFREILGKIDNNAIAISQPKKNQFVIDAGLPVEEVRTKLGIQLPEKKDFTTLSGLFIYHYGKYPQENSQVTIGDCRMVVKKMGKRKIDKILLIRHDREDTVT